MSLPDGERCLRPPQSLVVSLLLSPVFCTVQLRTLCAAHSLVTLCLFMTSGSDPGELPGFWGFMVFRHAPIPRKGSGKQQQQLLVFFFQFSKKQAQVVIF